MQFPLALLELRCAPVPRDDGPIESEKLLRTDFFHACTSTTCCRSGQPCRSKLCTLGNFCLARADIQPCSERAKVCSYCALHCPQIHTASRNMSRLDLILQQCPKTVTSIALSQLFISVTVHVWLRCSADGIANTESKAFLNS